MNKPGQRQFPQVVRIKKLKGPQRIYVAAAHNLREFTAQHGSYNGIDLKRTPLNYILRDPDTAIKVERLANDLMNRAGIYKLRKDAVRGVEIVFSLPPDFVGNSTAFFEDAVSWAEAHYRVPLLSAVVHCDQPQLHCHAILLPLVDGRMLGSDLVGNIHKLRATQENFAEQVGKAYGLTYQSDTPFAEGGTLGLNGRNILALIRRDPSLLDNESIFRALARAIKPTKALLVTVQKAANLESSIGLEPPGMSDREKPIGFDFRAMRAGEKPIGFRKTAVDSSMESLSCVGEVLEGGGTTRRKITRKRTLRKRIISDAKACRKQTLRKRITSDAKACGKQITS